MSLTDELRRKLGALEQDGLLRRPLQLLPGKRAGEAEIDGRRVLVFCSNDYLGLSQHPTLRQAIELAGQSQAAGATASRLIAGSHSAHALAERALAGLVRTPEALLFSSGYAANVGALAALIDRDDVVFSDELNHASLIDGIRLARPQVQIYPHADADALASLLGKHRRSGKRAWIVTESVFSMEGDLAPLVELRRLADANDAHLFVDEAHAIGVVGDGRGLGHHLGVSIDVLVGTAGKALGLMGAFVAGSVELRCYLENRARSYVFSTAMAPPIAAAMSTAVELLLAAHESRAKAIAHAARLRAELRERWTVVEGETPIIPVLLGDVSRTMEVSRGLLSRGFFVQGIRPPTVPAGACRLRLVPTAAHTDEDISALVTAFRELAR